VETEEYASIQEHSRWELSYEGILLVLLDESAPPPWRQRLLAFKNLRLAWFLDPQLGTERDAIVNVWVVDGQLWAGSWSGFSHRVSHQNGVVLETRFTK
jgi:hypothetical protein